MADGRYSPVKVLSDDEYEAMLRERLVRVEAEMALLDEEVERLKRMREPETGAKSGRE